MEIVEGKCPRICGGPKRIPVKWELVIAEVTENKERVNIMRLAIWRFTCDERILI